MKATVLISVTAMSKSMDPSTNLLKGISLQLPMIHTKASVTMLGGMNYNLLLSQKRNKDWELSFLSSPYELKSFK